MAALVADLRRRVAALERMEAAAGVDPAGHDHAKLVASDGSPDPALSADASGNLTQADGLYIATDEIRARDAGGLKLYEDGGNGIFVQDSTGNVGVGITPSTELVVCGDAVWASSADGQIRISGKTNADKRLNLGFDTTNEFGFIQAIEAAVAARDLVLQPGGGNIGVGVTPTQKLQVAGRIMATGTGYVANPAGPVFGQYTSTRGYVQAPAGGTFEIWQDSSVATAIFEDDGDVWMIANCSALSFTDRSPVFVGDALAALKKIKPQLNSEGDWREVNHDTLPQRLQKDSGGERSRDIGANIQLNSRAICQLTEMNEQFQARLEKLEKK